MHHYTTTTVDSKGNVQVQHHTEKVVTYRNVRPLKYTSWEEAGNSIRIPNDTTMFHAIVVPKYKLDDDAIVCLQQMREYMLQEALTHDVHASAWTSFTVEGLERSFCGPATKDKVCVADFFQSWYGRLLWVVFALLGYQAAYESIFAASGERVMLTVVKRVSMSDKLRCKYREQDQAAAESTFRKEGGVLQIPMVLEQQQFATPQSQFLMPGYAPENQYNMKLSPELEMFAKQQNIQPN